MFYVEHSDETEKPHPVAKKKDDNAVDKKREEGGDYTQPQTKTKLTALTKKTIT